MNIKLALQKGWSARFKKAVAAGANILVILLLCPTAVNGSSQTFRVLHHFTSGAYPQGSLALGDGVIYGTTERGGGFDYGTIYKVSTDGSKFTVLKEFTGNDGRAPQAGLIRSFMTLYGTTTAGGTYGDGTVFRIQVDGSGFQVLKSFNSALGEGDSPAGSEGLLLSGNTLYGMTQGTGASNGVAFGWGTVFKLQTDGSGYAVLKNFPGGDESCPWAGLAMEGATLYGTTSGWETYNRGTVFEIGSDGSGYDCLWDFTGGGDAAFPLGGVVVSGTSLFGTTYYGPGSQYPGGTVFRMNTDGTGYAILSSMVSCPRGGIVLSAGVLYGTAIYGGLSNLGSVYALTTNGATFTLLKEFTDSDGIQPWGSLALSGRTLYGTTIVGGAFQGGTLFALPRPVPSIDSGPVSQTAEAGGTVQFSVDADGLPPKTYNFLFNETNLLSAGTNASIALTNVQPVRIGAYSVIVTNLFGATTSAPAMLNVIAPVERRPVPGVLVTGQTASLLNVDYSPSLSPAPNWATLGSVSLTNASQYYFDLTLPLPPHRYYQAWQRGIPAVIPSLDLHMIPAITVTGSIGGSVRVDAINQFGPIDAWATLDTVTLTNTSQLYFDTSAPGQPQRLYRLIPSP